MHALFLKRKHMEKVVVATLTKSTGLWKGKFGRKEKSWDGLWFSATNYKLLLITIGSVSQTRRVLKGIKRKYPGGSNRPAHGGLTSSADRNTENPPMPKEGAREIPQEMKEKRGVEDLKSFKGQRHAARKFCYDPRSKEGPGTKPRHEGSITRLENSTADERAIDELSKIRRSRVLDAAERVSVEHDGDRPLRGMGARLRHLLGGKLRGNRVIIHPKHKRETVAALATHHPDNGNSPRRKLKEALRPVSLGAGKVLWKNLPTRKVWIGRVRVQLGWAPWA